MSEIRLVRCPKCDKVLPEPPVFTVYQCGGCGCMLRGMFGNIILSFCNAHNVFVIMPH